MIELPEAQTLARQMNEIFTGKTVARVEALQTPHGFAFFRGEPQGYAALLEGLRVTGVMAFGGRAELRFSGGLRLSFNDGVNPRYIAPGAPRPQKHQFLMEFGDGCAMACTVQMYGFFGLYPTEADTLDDFYYRAGVQLPSPLADAFDAAYFDALWRGVKPTLSAKAFLATEQRIPGLGNGVLQDILWNAGIHPKRKLRDMGDADQARLLQSVKSTLLAMRDGGGRDTERDLFGSKGGYKTVLSNNTLAYPCPKCGGALLREAYLGGKVYACAACQPL